MMNAPTSTGPIESAAGNAAKPGRRTSEFWATIAALGLTGLTVGAHALSVVPGPWMLPAVAVSAAIAAAGYAKGRADVKAAALAALGAVVAAEAKAP